MNSDLTVEIFDASICPSYSADQLHSLARSLGVRLASTSRKDMCLELRAHLPPSYSEYNGIKYLDPAKMRAVLARVPPEEADVYQFIWTHSKYYPTDVVLGLVNEAVDQFLALQVSPFLLYIPAKKWGSEQWLATTFYEKLGHPLIVHDLAKLKPGAYNLLILDDAAYSGTNLVMKLDEQLDNLKRAGRVGDYTFHFYVAAGLITTVARRIITGSAEHHGQAITIIGAAHMKTISEIVDEEKAPMDWYTFNKLQRGGEVSQFMGKTRPDYDATTVWLGHKVANVHGSMPTFLQPVLLHAPDRSLVEAAEAYANTLRVME